MEATDHAHTQHICQSQSPDSISLSFSSCFPQVCSPCLCLYFCFANKFICTILLIHIRVIFSSVQFSSVAQSCPTLCNPMNRSTPGLPVHHQLPEFTQTHIHRVIHPAISSSVIPFSSCPQSLPASESFPISQLFAWGGQNTRVSTLASFLPKRFQGWSPSEWTGWISLQSKGLSRVFYNTTVQRHQFLGTQFSSQSNSHIQHDHWKNYSLD